MVDPAMICRPDVPTKTKYASRYEDRVVGHGTGMAGEGSVYLEPAGFDRGLRLDGSVDPALELLGLWEW